MNHRPASLTEAGLVLNNVLQQTVSQRKATFSGPFFVAFVTSLFIHSVSLTALERKQISIFFSGRMYFSSRSFNMNVKESIMTYKSLSKTLNEAYID